MSPIVNREQKALIILTGYIFFLTEMPITSLRTFYMRDYFEKQYPDMLTNKNRWKFHSFEFLFTYSLSLCVTCHNSSVNLSFMTPITISTCRYRIIFCWMIDPSNYHYKLKSFFQKSFSCLIAKIQDFIILIEVFPDCK